ncbi:mechanosensitive ion channel family protein [Mucilaginibacter sp. X5P1]|uniref:mechanosensitive ion channel family protein n=1 Tax=Mucilaginibacter sp. X5P1 TaxID=2723088 RepID=UPI00161F32AD|nr:mechanosensitive ion channel domain-containing protein [Mucilaginibacter sp. X5P1]MBB6137390.1 small-conductance mechanosensitive channel [Mucilaginibacter sp. X5P1]
MRKTIKYQLLLIFLFTICAAQNGFTQKAGAPRYLREKQRKAMHSRDSLLRIINKSDTSVNSLLQRIEQYTTTFNQIRNNLAEGLDTADIGQQLPPLVKRLSKMDSLINTHKSSTLRYLFVLRDVLDRSQAQLEGWQSDLDDINSSLIQNQTDLIKFSKDTILKASPTDSALKKTFFIQRKALWLLWSKTDATNRSYLSKINLLQDKVSIAYTNVLDESDHIDSKIKTFADRAFAGEFGYIWESTPMYDGFKSPLNSTLKVNKLLFSLFIKNETLTHLAGFLFLVIILSWIIFNRIKVKRNNELSVSIADKIGYIYKSPVISSLLVATAVVPYFYPHPPVVFTEILFLFPMIFVLIFVKREFPSTKFKFLHTLFWLAIMYGVSNVFIEITNVDRFVILILSGISITAGLSFFKVIKKTPDDYLPYSGVIMQIFIGLQIISLLLNITGHFSLAKIIGVTSVFNLWLLVILYFVIQIITQALFLQFQTKKTGSILDWVDYAIVEEKFKKVLTLLTALIWFFFLFQNLNLDDAVRDYLSDFLSQSHTVGGASFTFEGFVIFIAVIWLSSIISKIISYFYDVSSLRATDMSVLKKKNRTSTLLIRLGVFSVGFLLAVAASGFPLDKITIIISAFGIGIGFGLQNIVNNLVSGLILAFEKPIQIGDIIEIDSRSGTIKEIGVRSSRLATSDGAEVIIPNGDLISHHVINWTLSNNNRRIELIIGVAYGSDIEKVKGLLKDMLANRDDIMAAPAPSVFLHNLNESSVDFRMFFWAADISTWLELKSRVLSDIYIKFAQEGIEIPFPTQDINLHLKDEHISINKFEQLPAEDGEKIKPNEGQNDKAEDIAPNANKTPSDPAK